MTSLENALIKTLQAASEYIRTGRIHAAHELIVATLNQIDNSHKLNPTTGEPACPSNSQ